MLLKIKKRTNLWIILSFIILSWLSTVLLMNTHSLFGTGDMPMHLHQLQEVKLALYHHHLVYYGLNEFHGSAVMTLYPWLNLWPAVIISSFFKSKVTVIYLYFVFNELLVMFISYFSSLSLSRSKRTSYLFAIFYSLSTLYLDYGFADMDWGEMLTMTFLPLIIFGSIALFKRGAWLELSTGMTLIISSHVLNTILVIIFLLLFFILNIFRFRFKIIVNLLKAIALTMFTTIAVWLPAFRILHLNPGMTMPPRSRLYGTPLQQIVSGAFRGDVTYGISLFALCGIILGLFYFLKLNRYLQQLYIISILVVVACSVGIRWWLTLPAFLSILQFTWRLYLVPELALSYVSAETISHFIKKWPKNFSICLIVGLTLIALGVQFESQQRLINIGINGQAPIMTQSYLKNHINHSYVQRGLNSGKYIETSFEHYPHANIKSPERFKLTGNRSYDSMFDQKRFLKTVPQYWPLLAKIHYNDINDHQIRSKQGLKSHLYNNGYNKFTFINQRPLTKVFLPLLHYNGERMNVRLDGHMMKVHSFQHTLFVDRLPKGTHKLSVNIQENKTYYISLITLIVGILMYVVIFIKILV